MIKQKTKALAKPDTQKAFSFLAISGVAIFMPFLVHSQWLTGPVVNALLILALFIIGFRAAVFISLVPSVVALSAGLLPALLAPMVPFIMISNIIFIGSIELIYRQTNNLPYSYWLSVLLSAFLKFGFLYASVGIISGLLIKQELSVKIAQVLSWPQFYTALLGGLIAWSILKIFKINNNL